MKSRSIAPCLALALVATSAGLSAAALFAADRPATIRPAPVKTTRPGQPAATADTSDVPAPPKGFVYGIDPDSSRYLPDSTLIASVGDRNIRVETFIDSYFGAWPEFRPRPDSAGRAEFLNTMINKEVLGIVATANYHDETFEERVVMREHTDRVLSNVLFRRMVYDSIRVEEADAWRVYPQYKYELHLRRLLFRDYATAERIREGLAKGRITWAVAAAAQGLSDAGGPVEGDLGWRKRDDLDPQVATEVFNLKQGQVSRVLLETLGLAIYQVVGRRPRTAPAYEGIRTGLLDQIRMIEGARRSEAMLSAMRARTGLVYDTANIVWAAVRFPEVLTTGGPSGRTFEMDTSVPQFDPVDTMRVLARFPDRNFTLGQFLVWYEAQSPYARVSANSFAAMRRQVDIAAQEPFMAQVAVERGLDKDPMAVELIERRREQLRMERLHQDSIIARVRVTEKERREFYEKNTAGFMTYSRVRFARLHAETQGEADSLVERLRSGVPAETIVLEDSLAGHRRGGIEWRSEEDHGSPYQKILFGELRPGQVMVVPASDGHFDVLQSIVFDAGHLLPYEEAAKAIDESLQNMAAQRLLDEFLERHKRSMRITAHPELVMRIRLVDPTL
jgi:hypothetical protein